MFQTLTLKKGESVWIEGNQRGKIIGMGTIGNSYSLSIVNIWFVDGLKHNLLSISQLYDSDYEVVFDKNNCTIIK